MEKTVIERRAARGAAFMDRKRPGWEKDINLSVLNIGDSERCVLGQRYGDHVAGSIVLGLSIRRQYRYGFMATKEGGCAEYPDLTEAWANEIIARLHHAIPSRTIKKTQRSAERQTHPSRS